MNKYLKIIIYSFMLVLTLKGASAFDNSTLTDYFALELSPANYPSNVSTGNTATAAGSNNKGVTGFHNQGLNLTGTGGSLSYSQSLSDEFSLVIWINESVTTDTNAVLFGVDDIPGGNNKFRVYAPKPASGIGITIKTGNGGGWDAADVLSGVNLNDNEWHSIIITINATSNRREIFIDGVLNASDYVTAVNMPSGLDIKVGRRYDNSAAYDFLGTIDEYMIFDNHIITSIEAAELYANLFYPLTFPPPPVTANESLEQTIISKQVGSVVVTGIAFATIFSDSFSIDLNNTHAYFDNTFSVLSNNNNEVYCEFLLDGVIIGNVSRDNIATETGNVNLLTGHVELSNTSTHNRSLRCKRNSGGGSVHS